MLTKKNEWNTKTNCMIVQYGTKVTKAYIIGHLPQGLQRLVGGRMAQYYDPTTAEAYQSKKSHRCIVM